MLVKKKIKRYFTLLGTDNNGIRHRYSVEKNEKFKEIFITFMASLGFDKNKISQGFWYEDEMNGSIPIHLRDINDVCKYYKNSKYEVDVFYGNKVILFHIRTNQKKKRDRRKTMITSLKKRSVWRKFPTMSRIQSPKKKLMIPNLVNRSRR